MVTFFAALRVRTKLALSFGFLLLLLCAIVGTAVWRIGTINATITHILDNRYAKVRMVSEVTRGVNAEARYVRNAIIAIQDAAEVRSLQARTAVALQKADQAVATLKTLVDRPQEADLYQALAERGAAYARGTQAIWRLIGEGQAPEAGDYLLQRLRNEQNLYFAALEAMDRFQSERMGREGAVAQAEGSAAVRLVLGLAALAVLASLLLSALIIRGLVRQLGAEPAELVSATQAIAGGDLTVPILVRPGDRHSVLSSMLGMRNRLADIVGQVRTGSETIASGSEQIASGNADLRQRTERQAGNLEETAASMEQIGAAVRQNADTATQASGLAAAAATTAGRGHGMVGQVAVTMEAIAASSRRIGDIIGVIDSIAFQTNILALNAAVEAARAGAEGRGFAVVATEVRNLAQRSATAAREIKSLIVASTEKVEAGAREVKDARASMDEIVAQVNSVSALIGEISASTAEQAGGIGQVGEAMTALDQVTQQNAALVEQSANAAESLRIQSAAMAGLVRMFHVGRTAAPSHDAGPAAGEPKKSKVTTALLQHRRALLQQQRAAQALPERPLQQALAA
ncbi:MAG: methyl-accepting chemotaxis protein [Pseudomonadota bacterium]